MTSKAQRRDVGWMDRWKKKEKHPISFYFFWSSIWSFWSQTLWFLIFFVKFLCNIEKTLVSLCARVLVNETNFWFSICVKFNIWVVGGIQRECRDYCWRRKFGCETEKILLNSHKSIFERDVIFKPFPFPRPNQDPTDPLALSAQHVISF